jgi:hypothetical protein
MGSKPASQATFEAVHDAKDAPAEFDLGNSGVNLISKNQLLALESRQDRNEFRPPFSPQPLPP